MKDLNTFMAKLFAGFAALWMIGVLCALPGYIRYQWMLPKLVRVEATIVQIEERIEKGYGEYSDTVIQDVHITYRVNGQEYRTLYNKHRDYMHVGDAVTVLVDPADPEGVVENPTGIFIVLCVCAASCLGVSGSVFVYYAVKGRRAGRRQVS